MVDKEELYDEAIDLYADEKYDEAIELYKRALEEDPKYIDALHGLTMCYQAKGDLAATLLPVADSTTTEADDRREDAAGKEVVSWGSSPRISTGGSLRTKRWRTW